MSSSLTKAEMEFVGKINAICEWLSRPRATHEDVIQQIIVQYPIKEVGKKPRQMEEKEAKKWLFKALEVLRSGSKQHQDVARGIYASRLLRLADEAEKMLTQTKTVTRMKPQKGPNGGNAGLAVVEVIQTSARMDPSLLGQVRMLLREFAHVTGARPKDPPIQITPGDENVMGLPGSREVRDMGAEALANLLNVKILPNKSAAAAVENVENGPSNRSAQSQDVVDERPAKGGGSGEAADGA